jgi:NAD(P)H-hydrate epimerase
MQGDAQEQVKRLGGEPQAFEAERLDRAHLIVDALLGTGSTGAPRDPAGAVIEAMEAARAPVVAADVPSGVDATTGEVAGVAVHAVATATFHRGKPGLWIHPGKAHAGTVEVIEIGIPRGGPAKPDVGLVGAGVLRDMPRREGSSTKFSSGNVFVIGGSRGLTGAPTMAALAAMRAGAGYVTVAAPESLEATFSVRLLEAMMVGLPHERGGLTEEAVEPALRAIQRADAVVLGPGLGRTDGAQGFARAMFERIDVPLVIDADGLNALAGCFPEDLPQRRWPTILTPHAGELARLLETDAAWVSAHRLEAAARCADRFGAVTVVKGPDTIVRAPDGRTVVCDTGPPSLATAGTGDVLTGVLGAFLAKGLDPTDAAVAAAVAHGLAARSVVDQAGLIASDVVSALPAVLA